MVVAMLLMVGRAEAGRGGGGHRSTSHGTGSSPSSHAVRGYTKKDGTHVEAHRATNADKTQLNNYSTRGNVNPSNGKVGTRTPTR